MSRKFEVDDYVIWIDKDYSDWWKNWKDISLYGKIAKIIYINKTQGHPYLLEFTDWINGNGHNGNPFKIKGKEGHCKWGRLGDFKSAINHLKFKKWIRG